MAGSDCSRLLWHGWFSHCTSCAQSLCGACQHQGTPAPAHHTHPTTLPRFTLPSVDTLAFDSQEIRDFQYRPALYRDLLGTLEMLWKERAEVANLPGGSDSVWTTLRLAYAVVAGIVQLPEFEPAAAEPHLT